MQVNTIIQGDAREVLKTLPDNSINCCVTSPPYWGLRDYGVEGQFGLEKTPEEYVSKMVEVFREVKRVLRGDGTLWLNLGDSYCGTGNKGKYKDPKYLNGRNGQRVALNNKIKGLKPKDLVGIPWRVAFALQADGWWLRQDIIWHKPNPIPESVTDRCTKAHEYIFLLTKKRKYFYDREAIREAPKPGRVYKEVKGANKRSVWTIPAKPFKGAHFAVFPPDLIRPCILAGCPVGGVVLDPFMGSGTTALVAFEHERNYLGIELNPEYIKLANRRLRQSMNFG